MYHTEDYVLDTEADENGQLPVDPNSLCGPYTTDEEATRAATKRWAGEGVAISRRVGDDLCEADGSPICRVIQSN